jgi:hypothetical protein
MLLDMEKVKTEIHFICEEIHDYKEVHKKYKKNEMSLFRADLENILRNIIYYNDLKNKDFERSYSGLREFRFSFYKGDSIDSFKYKASIAMSNFFPIMNWLFDVDSFIYFIDIKYDENLNIIDAESPDLNAKERIIIVNYLLKIMKLYYRELKRKLKCLEAL